MSRTKQKYRAIDLSQLENHKVACMTLDLEQDYGDLLDEPSYEGLQYIPDLVSLFKESNIPLTCFVQGSLLETHPGYIEPLLTLDVEFELHSYSHPNPVGANMKFEIERGKQAYVNFFHREPVGYRAPLGLINGKDYEVLASNRFKFDSSVFPSLRLGVFNNLTSPTKPCLMDNTGILEFPFTVFSNLVRIPVGLSYIKLLGKPYFHLLKTCKLPRLIVFGFHLHDLYPLSSSSKIPSSKFSPFYRAIFKRIYQGNDNGMKLLEDCIIFLQSKEYQFRKLTDVYELINGGNQSGW